MSSGAAAERRRQWLVAAAVVAVIVAFAVLVEWSSSAPLPARIGLLGLVALFAGLVVVVLLAGGDVRPPLRPHSGECELCQLGLSLLVPVGSIEGKAAEVRSALVEVAPFEEVPDSGGITPALSRWDEPPHDGVPFSGVLS